MGKIIGIDLGTTNSVVAVMEGGEPVVIGHLFGVDEYPAGEGRRGHAEGGDVVRADECVRLDDAAVLDSQHVDHQRLVVFLPGGAQVADQGWAAVRSCGKRAPIERPAEELGRRVDARHWWIGLHRDADVIGEELAEVGVVTDALHRSAGPSSRRHLRTRGLSYVTKRSVAFHVSQMILDCNQVSAKACGRYGPVRLMTDRVLASGVHLVRW